MTGDAADAEDLVQETLTRALERPRSDASDTIGPWLTSIAANLAKDRLRQRQRRSYPCPWLPAPVETEGENAAPVLESLRDDREPAARYELLESVSYAFLRAIEVLTPQQRAVLLLRDVFDLSVRECASCLETSEANVKTTHLRARRAMAAYDADRRPPGPVLEEQTRQAISALMTCLTTNDVAGAERLLAPKATTLNDGGGGYLAANLPVVGARKIVTFHTRLMGLRGPPDHVDLRMINGLPGLVLAYDTPAPRTAARAVMVLELDRDGRIAGLHSILADRKLSAIRR